MPPGCARIHRTNGVTYPQYLNYIAGFATQWCAPTSVANRLDCYDPHHYAELMFVDSDTTMTVARPTANVIGSVGRTP